MLAKSRIIHTFFQNNKKAKKRGTKGKTNYKIQVFECIRTIQVAFNATEV